MFSVKRARSNRKTIVVGFDFGTHSTKVVFRERNQRNGRILQFDQSAEGYPRLASPSLVRCVGERLYFGTEALTRLEGTLYRSLKVDLLPGSTSRNVPPPIGMDIPMLVAAYFSWAFLKLSRRLPAESHRDAIVHINLAAPMSHFENPHLKDKYLRIVQAAWKASEPSLMSIDQGISISEVIQVLKPLLKEPVRGSEHRHFVVLPETIAPVVSLGREPLMEPGMYMIVDTGAGTTEMSVVYVGETGAYQKVLCYQDETILLGGNDLHLAAGLEATEQSAQLKKIADRLEKQLGCVWKKGYDLDKDGAPISRERWKQLTVVPSGGGTKHDEVARLLQKMRQFSSIRQWLNDSKSLKVIRHTPTTIEPGTSKEDLSLFVVANGLAIERQRWPVRYHPEQIEPLTSDAEVADKPQGYWYVDAK